MYFNNIHIKYILHVRLRYFQKKTNFLSFSQFHPPHFFFFELQLNFFKFC